MNRIGRRAQSSALLLIAALAGIDLESARAMKAANSGGLTLYQ
jgi:hypothetical protein